MKVMFDTGSADVWLYSQQGCEASGFCPDRDWYQEGLSANYKRIGGRNNDTEPGFPIYISYALGTVHGHMVQDTMCFGPSVDYKPKPQQKTNQTESESSKYAKAYGCISQPIKFLTVNNAT